MFSISPDNGGPGDELTLTGQHFFSAETVRFTAEDDGTFTDVTTFTVVSDTVLRVIAPAGYAAEVVTISVLTT